MQTKLDVHTIHMGKQRNNYYEIARNQIGKIQCTFVVQMIEKKWKEDDLTLVLLGIWFDFMINLLLLLKIKAKASRLNMQFAIHFIYNALDWYPLCWNCSPQDLILILLLLDVFFRKEKEKLIGNKREFEECCCFLLPHCYNFITRRWIDSIQFKSMWCCVCECFFVFQHRLF